MTAYLKRYLKALRRSDDGKPVGDDSIIMSLWEDNKEYADKLREITYKLSISESRVALFKSRQVA